MVSKDKEFEYVTSQIIKHVERSVDAFKMFAQLFSAIVGGTIWLSMQSNVSLEATKIYAYLSGGLAMLVVFIAVFMIHEDYRAWRGFREAQSKLVPHVKKPSWHAEKTAYAMIACMIIAGGAFCWFNPFFLAPKTVYCVPSAPSPSGGQK
jgi:hypothetical protein